MYNSVLIVGFICIYPRTLVKGEYRIAATSPHVKRCKGIKDTEKSIKQGQKKEKI